MYTPYKYCLEYLNIRLYERLSSPPSRCALYGGVMLQLTDVCGHQVCHDKIQVDHSPFFFFFLLLRSFFIILFFRCIHVYK